MNCSKDCDDGARTGPRVGAEAGFEHLVLADIVDDLFVLLLDLEQEFAELRIVEAAWRLLDQRCGCLLNLLLARLIGPNCSLGPLFMPVWIDRVDELPAEVFEREAAAGFADGLLVFLRDAVLQAGQPSGEAGEHVFSAFPKRDGWSSLSKVTVGFFSSGRESVLSRSQTPTASTMTKWSLAWHRA